MLETYIDQKRGQIINFRFEPFLERLHGLEEFKNLDVPIFTLPEEKETKTPAQSENISNGSEMEAQFKKLLQYIETERPYLNSQLNLNSLSGKVSLHPNKLSFLINEKTGNNFNEFINHYRLNYFKSIVHNPEFKHMTLLGIAYESGFNSKTVFNAFFKKTEGVSPSAWKKKAQKK
jgi:AraC-like DNA-binding protein